MWEKPNETERKNGVVAIYVHIEDGKTYRLPYFLDMLERRAFAGNDLPLWLLNEIKPRFAF